LKDTKEAPGTLLNGARWRVESDSLGDLKPEADRLWRAQTQRSLEHVSIGQDLIPPEMISSYATLKISLLRGWSDRRAGGVAAVRLSDIIAMLRNLIPALRDLYDVIAATIWLRSERYAGPHQNSPIPSTGLPSRSMVFSTN
jgi:hypothetical protein